VKKNKKNFNSSNKIQIEPNPDHKRIKDKKAVIILVIVIILILIISQILYYFVLPRVTVDLRTVYHEATGGGGTGGLININSEITNSGTVDINSLEITIIVLNSTDVMMINENYYHGLLTPGESHEIKLVTNGNCYEDYYITVDIHFETTNQEFSEKFNYRTHEDAMNIGFHDSIFKWEF